MKRDYDKIGSLQQPLRSRRDYDETSEAAMFKEIPQEDIEQEESDPEDTSNPLILPARGLGRRWIEGMPPGRGLGPGRGQGPGAALGPGMGMGPGRGRMVCPICGGGFVFKLGALEKYDNIPCPYCTENISTASMYKSGHEYRAVIAKCLDPNFKAIRKKLPKAKQVILTGKDISDIHKHLDTIYKKYRELESKIKTAGWQDKQKAIDNVKKAMKILGWQGGTVHQIADETGLTVEQIHEADDIETLVKEALKKKQQVS